MNRLWIVSAIILSNSAFAGSNRGVALQIQKINEADSVGTQLIKEFDQLTATVKTPAELYTSEVYSKLMALRPIQESHSDALEEAYSALWQDGSLEETQELSPTFPGTNVSVADEISLLAPKYRAQLQAEFDTTDAQPKIYPDPGTAGNIFGTEFPTGVWALTFDDGPSTVYSPTVIANLKAHGLRATFFELMGMIKQSPATSLMIRDAGMEVEDHSYTHPQLTKMDPKTQDYEIRQSAEDEAAVWGFRPKFFRCPYGDGLHDQAIRKQIADQGMIHVYWTVDTLDWQDHNPDSIFQRALQQMTQFKRGIILFHDIHPQSVAGSKLVMDYLVAQKLRVVTIPDIVDEINQAQNLGN